MTTVILAVLAFVLLAALTSLLSDQALGEAKRLSLLLIRQATAGLPQDVAQDLREELIAEIESLFAEHQPLRGLFEALRFAVNVRRSRDGLEEEHGKAAATGSFRSSPGLKIEALSGPPSSPHMVRITNTTKRQIVNPRIQLVRSDGSVRTVSLPTEIDPGETITFVEGDQAQSPHVA